MTEHRLDLTALAQSLIDGEHSIFSASGSGLYLHCAGGLIPNLLAPDDSGQEAAEGTVAHGCGESWLKTGKRPTHLIGTKQTVGKFTIEITAEMLSYVQEYVDWCAWLPGQHFVETKVYYSEYTPLKRQGGTADHVACSYQRMVITDLKYGKGYLVEVEGNTQAMLYALGFFLEWDWLYDFQVIELRICQPRMKNLAVTTITRAQLLAFAELFRVGTAEAWKLDAPRTPGEKQCRFCRVKASCAAHLVWQAKITSERDNEVWGDMIQAVTVEDVEDLRDKIEFNELHKLTDVYTLTTAEMVAIFKYRSLFEGWWKRLHTELNLRVARGEKVPGMKLVEGRSFRKIRSKKEALDVLLEAGLSRDELITEEFASPADIERLLRAHGLRPKEVETVLAPLVDRPKGKPTLVSDADKRPAISDLSEIAFSDLIQPETPEIEEP